MNTPYPFLSAAEWPPGTPGTVGDVSTDGHDTVEQAAAVCQMLERLGLGGDGKVFPVRTWVQPSNFIQWLTDLRAWQLATFPGMTPASVYEHLRSEVVDELSADPSDPGELADVLLLTLCLCFLQGINPLDALARKDAINRRRTWAKTAEGYRHVDPAAV